MDENHHIGWDVLLRVYWTILWRSVALSFALAFPFKFFLTWLLATGRIGMESLLLGSKLFLALTMVCIGFITVGMALRKRYRGFRIQIVRDQA